MKGLQARTALLTVAAPVLALLLAAALASVALYASGINPGYAFRQMAVYGADPDSIVDILNRSTYYYIAAVAVAVGFRMNLFNIGVDGQYQLAAMLAAAVGGAAVLRDLPGPLLVLAMVLVAVVTGALWAGIAGVLKVTRGVSEVISTIMLNAIGGGIVAYLISERGFGVLPPGGNITTTRTIPESAWLPDIPLIPGARSGVFGFAVVAIVVGVGYWFALNRTRPGFDLRAAGANAPAALASGVDVRRMVVTAMLVSGGLAGLVGLPLMLGEYHNFTSQFPAGIGFTGIAIALIGRNHPVGIAFGALLWSFLDRSQQILDLESIPKEIVQILQGVSVLAVVVAYELVRRLVVRLEQRRVGEELGTAVPTGVSA
ncbi:MAG TPA: ABC transporter permease [Mycobacteriales bacterium]|nr:sugar transporter permease [Mycobacterium sp.]